MSSQDTDDLLLLAGCLERIEAGLSPETALAELPPADQQHLAPLLSVALSLRQPLAPLRPAFRAGLQATLAEMEAATGPRVAATARPLVWRRVVGALVAVVLLVLGSFGLALAASYSVPADALYPLKQGLEQVVAALTPTVVQPALDRRLAAERLREAGVLLARGAERAEVLATLDEARALLVREAVGQTGPGGPPGPVPRRGPPRLPSPISPTSPTPAIPALTQVAAAASSAPGMSLTTATPTTPPTPPLAPPTAPPPTALPHTAGPKPMREPTSAATPTLAPSPTPASVRIEGVVLRDGTVVVGALVSAWLVEPGQPCAVGAEPVRGVVTDDEGRYVVEGLAPGTYQVSAEGGPLCLPRRWFAGAADLAVPDPCGGGARLIELPVPGSGLQLANVLYEAGAGGCPGSAEPQLGT